MLHKPLLHILLLISALVCLTACEDDRLYDSDEIIEGQAEIQATVFFEKLATAPLGRGRSSGEAIKKIQNLCVLVYSEDGTELKKSFYANAADGMGTGTFTKFLVNQEGNSSRPDDKETSAETVTPSADIRFVLLNGKYKIYAVANMGDLANNEYKDNVKTEDGLKNISLVWTDKGEAENYAIDLNTNNQMLGYFAPDGSANGFDAPVINTSKKRSIFCWLRRAASKVTVAFDGSNLNQNINIYLQSVEIKDIPKNCFLGADNTPKSKDEITQGEIIYYSTDADFHNWPTVTRGRRKTFGLADPDTKLDEDQRLPLSDYHSEKSPALYFFENLQGEGKDKRQDANGDGELDAPGLPGDPGYINKDNELYGTYIEVKGYYRALNSEGPIIYRFMLGKNELKDYNAERNFHYKLTLVFNGNANDVDWHIEYKEDFDIIAPDPYYISYLYDQDVLLPIKLKGDIKPTYYLTAEITENNWFPDNATDIEIVKPGTEKNPGVWHGFLSLSATKDKVIGDGKHYKNDATWNKDYWNNHPEKGFRTYDKISDPGTYGDKELGQYVVEKDDENTIINIPFYTRAKQMVPTTGYTGNNPYAAYRRKAMVKLTVYDSATGQVVKNSKGEPMTKTITIYQVRRVVNPKGVWRSWDKDDAFHAVLKILPKETSPKFENLISDGPWRATVEAGKDWIKINDKLDGIAEGDHDTPIDFWIQPDGKANNELDIRCGIILVEYNNYTCKHRIFVRQGLAPLAIDEGIKWHTCNMYTKDKETNSPLEEGSLFKFANWDDAIGANNNETFGFQVAPGDKGLQIAGTSNSKSWNDIKVDKGIVNKATAWLNEKDIGTFVEKTRKVGFSETEVDNTVGYNGRKAKVRVATEADYKALRNGQNREFGYGVLYGDGATETQDELTMAYGYTREANDPKRGMRGCFVYNSKTGHNLFFPIGATGYGKRKSSMEWYGYKGSAPGALQYAWRSEKYADDATHTLLYRPLFLDVYRRPGAVYWFKDLNWSRTNTVYQKDASGNYILKSSKGVDYKIVSSRPEESNMFLDINYFTFDFEIGATEVLEKRLNNEETSACFVRCVED